MSTDLSMMTPEQLDEFLKAEGETNWGGYTPTKEEFEENEAVEFAKEEWRIACHDQMIGVLDSSSRIAAANTDWIRCLNPQRYEEVGGWNNVGKLLTQTYFGVCEHCPQQVWAEMIYMRLTGHPEWSLDRFLNFAWSQYRQAEKQPREERRAWFVKRLASMKERQEGRYGSTPRPSAFGSWS